MIYDRLEAMARLDRIVPLDKVHVLIDGELFNALELHCESAAVNSIDEYIESLIRADLAHKPCKLNEEFAKTIGSMINEYE